METPQADFSSKFPSLASDGNAVLQRAPKGSQPLVIELSEAAAIVRRLCKDGAVSGITPPTLATAMENSLTSSSFVRKLGALKTFGLLTGNDPYALTDRGICIGAPRSPQAGAEALRDAFISVPVFASLFSQNKGKLMPADEFLRNLIEQDRNIPKDVSPKWIEQFKNGARFIGILHDRGGGRIQISENPILGNSSSPDATEVEPAAPTEPAAQPATTQSATAEQKQSDTSRSTNAVIPEEYGHTTKIEVSGKRFAIFFIPDNLNERDTAKLKRALQGLAVIIESMTVDETPVAGS